jgi:hypothetical protein
MKGPRSPKARTQLVKSSEGFCPKCDSKIISCAYSLLQKGIWSAYLLAGSRSRTEVNPNYAPASIHIPVLQWKHTQDRHTQYVWACLHSAIRTGIITLTPTNYKWGHSILLYTPIVLACFSYPKLTWVQATSFQIGSCLGTCSRPGFPLPFTPWRPIFPRGLWEAEKMPGSAEDDIGVVVKGGT